MGKIAENCAHNILLPFFIFLKHFRAHLRHVSSDTNHGHTTEDHGHQPDDQDDQIHLGKTKIQLNIKCLNISQSK
jgi:hypothetical protein